MQTSSLPTDQEIGVEEVEEEVGDYYIDFNDYEKWQLPNPNEEVTVNDND